MTMFFGFYATFNLQRCLVSLEKKLWICFEALRKLSFFCKGGTCFGSSTPVTDALLCEYLCVAPCISCHVLSWLSLGIRIIPLIWLMTILGGKLKELISWNHRSQKCTNFDYWTHNLKANFLPKKIRGFLSSNQSDGKQILGIWLISFIH